jgi:hypothetical protein
MGTLPHPSRPEGNDARTVSPNGDRTGLRPALRGRPLARCPGWTGSPCSSGWRWPW